MSGSIARGPRVLVIGAAAHIFPSHWPGLRDVGAEVVGVHDVNAERLQPVAEHFGCPAFTDLDALLAVPADLAVIVAPHPFHAELAVKAMQAGLDVLTEKPMAVEVAEADRMVLEAERLGRVLAVSFQHRTRTEVQAARKLIQDGGLGVIQRVDLLATWPRRIGYFQSAAWRASWQGEGGGVLINQGQHDLDVLGYVAGYPSRIVAWGRTQLQPIETEDTMSAMVGWPSGAVGFIHISTAESDEEQRIEITGTGGRLRLTKGRLEVLRNDVDMRDYVVSPGNPYQAPPTLDLEVTEGTGGKHLDIYRDLIAARAEGRPPIAAGSSALLTLELTNALTYSAYTGQEVNLPLDRGAYSELLRSLRAGSGAGR
jgi:predicted dehydrogenase